MEWLFSLLGEDPEANTHQATRNPSDDWFISIFGEDGSQNDPEAGSKHRIQKVPSIIREYEKDKKYFDPRVVSLGPYHHGKPHLMPMEKHKIAAAKQFIDESIDRIGRRERIYEMFMETIGVMKGCYAAEAVANLTDDVFACMMFLDGCFVLYFILGIIRGKIYFEISNELIPLIIWDMLLIENQLPFEVLETLSILLFGSTSTGKYKILEFINSEVLIPMGMFYPVHTPRPLNWCGEQESGEHDHREDQGARDAPLHLLDVLRTILLDFPPSEWAKKNSNRPRNFGSVMELKEDGIRLEKRIMGSLMGIRFEENLLFPRLLLPPMFINDATLSQLLNLTVFEVCSDTYSGCGVTSYICFMDSLINDAADVKMLRSNGILHHALGSDEEVARLFNTWPVEVMNDLELYSHVSGKIRWHHDRKGKISIARWLDKYFGSPWTAISFVAAVLLLIFTLIQTVCTVITTVG